MMVLVKAAMRLMLTAWAVKAISLAAPGAADWLNSLSLALFSVAAWDLVVVAGFWVRDLAEQGLSRQRGCQAEIDRCQRAFAVMRISDKSVDC